MRRLLLLRHAKTEKDSATGLDRDRKLDARGHTDAPALGAYMARTGLVPDLALISPAVRTAETWQLLAPCFAPRHPRGDTIPELYNADSTQLLRLTRTAQGESPTTLLIVAHNPGIHEYALALTRDGDKDARAALTDTMPTCGLAVIDFAIDDWHDVAFRSGRLERFVSPRLLREAEG